MNNHTSPDPTNDAAIDYWIENTQKIYDSKLHISEAIIEAFTAGAKWANQPRDSEEEVSGT